MKGIKKRMKERREKKRREGKERTEGGEDTERRRDETIGSKWMTPDVQSKVNVCSVL